MVKSLKVVRTSDWLAEVCILSKAWARCSLSICETVEMELKDSRRALRSSVEGMEGEKSDRMGVLGSMAVRDGRRLAAPELKPYSRQSSKTGTGLCW